jgi:hypothetical protein
MGEQREVKAKEFRVSVRIGGCYKASLDVMGRGAFLPVP